MAQGKRTNIADKANIIATKINNPDLSTRDIECAIGIPHETVAKVLREDFTQVCTQSKAVAELIDNNELIIQLAGRVVVEKIGEERAIDAMRIQDMAVKQNELVKLRSPEDRRIIIEVQTL